MDTMPANSMGAGFAQVQVPSVAEQIRTLFSQSGIRGISNYKAHLLAAFMVAWSTKGWVGRLDERKQKGFYEGYYGSLFVLMKKQFPSSAEGPDFLKAELDDVFIDLDQLTELALRDPTKAFKLGDRVVQHTFEKVPSQIHPQDSFVASMIFLSILGSLLDSVTEISRRVTVIDPV